MSGLPASPTSPGTEAPGDIHYLVFSPSTPPLGQETDPPITSAFAAFAAGTSHSLDLILRVADPDQLHRDPDLDYWLRVRVYPDRASFQHTGPVEATFNGTAFKLTEDGRETDEYICVVTIQFIDRPADSRIGELALSTGGTA